MRLRRALSVKAAAVALVATALPLLGTTSASADPIIDSGNVFSKVTSANGSKIKSVKIDGPQKLTLTVYSGSMGADIPVEVQRPRDTSAPRPVLYLLNGAGGGVDNAAWTKQTDALPFLAGKDINVVTPLGGAWSYYTDWIKTDPVLGNNKWTTFLTKELPPIVDAALKTNGRNSIAGLSTSGTTVLANAVMAPGLYKSLASYSGCAQTSDPIGQQFVKLTVETWGGGKTENMWGPPNDPLWAANDPYLHADKLRGVAMYISSGNGLPGRHDNLQSPQLLNKTPYGLANQVVIGGVIEAATNYCTNNLAAKLGQLGIPAHVNFAGPGTHSWGYWQDAFKDSWPVIAGPLDIAI